MSGFVSHLTQVQRKPLQLFKVICVFIYCSELTVTGKMAHQSKHVNKMNCARQFQPNPIQFMIIIISLFYSPCEASLVTLVS